MIGVRRARAGSQHLGMPLSIWAFRTWGWGRGSRGQGLEHVEAGLTGVRKPSSRKPGLKVKVPLEREDSLNHQALYSL